MTVKSLHLDDQEWLDWVLGNTDPERERSMKDHLKVCSRCAQELPAYSRLRRSRQMPHWVDAPVALRKKSRSRPQVARAPVPGVHDHRMGFAPADMRGHTLVAAAEPGSLHAMLSSAEIGIVAHPPTNDPYWEIEGRVWLHEPTDAPIDIMVFHETHVIAHENTRDGEFFRIREILPRGWALEIHLPDEHTVTLQAQGS